jgi:hypothetical protein
LGENIAVWERVLDQEWATLKLGRVGINPVEGGYEYSVEVTHGSVDPGSLLVELYADPQGAGEPFRRAMTRGPVALCGERAGRARIRRLLCADSAGVPRRERAPRERTRVVGTLTA